jgi:hypothetical protein
MEQMQSTSAASMSYPEASSIHEADSIQTLCHLFFSHPETR